MGTFDYFPTGKIPSWFQTGGRIEADYKEVCREMEKLKDYLNFDQVELDR